MAFIVVVVVVVVVVVNAYLRNRKSSDSFKCMAFSRFCMAFWDFVWHLMYFK